MSRRMPLRELLPDVPGIADELAVTGLTQDSRELRPGDGFVALAGDGAHGLAFVEQARAAGAAAILYQPPVPAGLTAPADAIAVPGLQQRLGQMADALHGQPSRAMRMIGVTGTSGKTSSVQMLAQALALLGHRPGTIGTLGAGLHGQEVATGFTTPLVLQMHALLAQMRDAGADVVAMEVSSHGLDQGRVDGVHYDIAAFTNLSRDHLDYHADMAEYAETKAKLFVRPGLKAAVINLDDAFGRELFARLPAGVRGIGVSSRGNEAAQVRAEAVQIDVGGLRGQLLIDGLRLPLASPLIGRFNVDNLLLVAGVLLADGVDAERIGAVLPQLQPIAGRMNRLGGDGRLPLVVVDYSHKPDPLQQALQSLRAHVRGRLLCVFGCGGERDRGKRPLMARIAEDHADVVIITDDNPRGEDGDAIVAEIAAGLSRPQAAIIERDRGAAIARAIAMADADDAVLIAGKGHETYQEVAGVQHPFDDRAVAAAALAQRAAEVPA